MGRGMWGWVLLPWLGSGLVACGRPLLPDTVSVTAVAADPAGIPQPHVAVSVTYFLSPTHVMMETPTTTTLPVGTR